MRLDSEQTPRAKLIDATLKLMAKRGDKNISNRAILSEAGMSNLSAISYHFGSREELIRTALRHYFDQLYTVFESVLESSKEGAELLMEFAQNSLKVIAEKPGLEKALLTFIVMAEDPNPDFQIAVKNNFNIQKKIMARATKITDDIQLAHRVMSFKSSLVYPFLLSRYGKKATGFNFHSPKETKAYLQSLVSMVMQD